MVGTSPTNRTRNKTAASVPTEKGPSTVAAIAPQTTWYLFVPYPASVFIIHLRNYPESVLERILLKKDSETPTLAKRDQPFYYSIT
jgi:hypothetical protein